MPGGAPARGAIVPGRACTPPRRREGRRSGRTRYPAPRSESLRPPSDLDESDESRCPHQAPMITVRDVFGRGSSETECDADEAARRRGDGGRRPGPGAAAPPRPGGARALALAWSGLLPPAPRGEAAASVPFGAPGAAPIRRVRDVEV